MSLGFCDTWQMEQMPTNDPVFKQLLAMQQESPACSVLIHKEELVKDSEFWFNRFHYFFCEPT